MAVSLDQIAAEALTLPLKEREQLANLLYDSVNVAEDIAPLSDEWLAEIERRIQEIDDGAETFPVEEVLARIRAELRQKNA